MSVLSLNDGAANLVCILVTNHVFIIDVLSTSAHILIF